MISLQAPFNPTSIGQTSYNLFKAMIKKGEEIRLFPYQNQIDLSCFNVSGDDHAAIQSALDAQYSRSNPSLQVWHIRDSEANVGRHPSLMTFHETSEITKREFEVLQSYDTVFVSSSYTQLVFESAGLENVVHTPLGFDADSFQRIEKPDTDVITFGLRGKVEDRKNTLRILKIWAKQYGGNPKYRLDCSINSFFVKQDELLRMVQSVMPDKCIPWNINLLPFCQQNFAYNQALNNADIDLTGMSSCEGFNLPLYQSLALGKHAVVLNAHVHKDYCNEKNSVLVEPSGMRDASDGKFFIPGQDFNQGQWFDFDDDDFVEAMGVAESRFLTEVRNTRGEELRLLTFENTADDILYHL